MQEGQVTNRIDCPISLFSKICVKLSHLFWGLHHGHMLDHIQFTGKKITIQNKLPHMKHLYETQESDGTRSWATPQVQFCARNSMDVAQRRSAASCIHTVADHPQGSLYFLETMTKNLPQATKLQ